MARQAGMFFAWVCAGTFINVDLSRADGQFPVAGSDANAWCEIVTTRSVINPLGPLQFATGRFCNDDDANKAQYPIPMDEAPKSAEP